MSDSPADFFAKSETLARARNAGMVDLSYNLQINEYQRALVYKMLQKALGDPALVLELLDSPAGKVPACKNALDEAAFITQQFGDTLVANENAMPGVTHALCF